MAIVVRTDRPQGLLAAIKAEIDAGKIDTWRYDSDGDFSHSPDQWRHKAWLRPSTGAGELVFKILTPTNQKMSRVVYAVYHGRFIEMLLTHFDLRFTSADASALPERGDIVA
jgi:hypothetical protein